MTRKRILVTLGVLMLLIPSAGCRTGERAEILYINSYHAGYGSSDEVMAGIEETLPRSRVRLTTFFMDSKRHPELVESKAAEALRQIERVPPDVIIASDDNAVKFVVVPHFRDGPIPCVFCGVNWTCEQYGLPTPNVTGMLEILPVRETVQALRGSFPDAARLVVLSENTTSEQTNRKVLVPIFADLGLTTDYLLVDTYEQWKEQFRRANAEADMIFLPTNGAIKGWDEPDAKAFVAREIRVPVFTCDDFMMPYAVFGLTKIAREQGEWAAQAALSILGGESPGQFAITRNSRTEAWINRALARKVGFRPGSELLRRARSLE